jgi:two-component system LytT family sensor kinase
MQAVHEPLLVNTIGHAIGAVTFAIFIYLLLTDRGARQRASGLSLLAASLAMVWNLSSLLVIPLPPDDQLSHILSALGASALSLLPAVLLHISPAGRLRWIVIPGYALSAAAVGIHLSEFLAGTPNVHRLGLILITIGFGALTLAAAIPLFSKAQAGERQRVLSSLLGTMALFLFAMSFVHLGYAEVPRAWPVELLLHHAGIPLALVVLLQDYRFVLLDAFLRFLANTLFAGGLTFLALRAAPYLGITIDFGASKFRQGLLLVLACFALIVFAMLRTTLQSALTRVLFKRPELEGTLVKLRNMAAGSEAQFIAFAAEAMGRFMNAVIVDPGQAAIPDLHFPTLATDLRDTVTGRDIEVIVPVRLPQGATRPLCLGRRQGGRPYLSEDLHALARLSAEVSAQLERLRETEMQRLVSQAELRALQSQIHPHFLFNAFNTLYGVIPKQADAARRLVLNLADIFRYFLQTERSFIPLEEELRIVTAYLEIESLRLGPKLRTEIDADPSVLSALIPILSVEPLVENAVKHGVAAKTEGGLVRVIARPDSGGVLIRVEDSGRGFDGAANGHGVGLTNVERRLRLCYGPDSALRIQSSPAGTSVEFHIPIAKEALR